MRPRALPMLALLGLSGCKLFLVEPGPVDQRSAVETLPARCVQAPPALEVAALDVDADRMLLTQATDTLSPARVFRYSQDGGESWENMAVAAAGTEAGARIWGAWGGRPVITRVREDVWGVLGAEWEVEGGTGRSLAVVTTDGGATWVQLLGEDGGATVDGVVADATYTISADERIAVVGGLTFGSTDGGASWFPAGATHAWNVHVDGIPISYDVLAVGDGVALAFSDSSALDNDQGVLLRPDGVGDLASRMSGPHGAFLDDGRLATLGGSGSGNGLPVVHLNLTDLESGEIQSLPLAAGLTSSSLGLFRDGAGRVWVSGAIRALGSVAVDRDGENVTWRYDPATGQLSEIRLDIGHPAALRIVDGVARGAGVRLFVEAPRWAESDLFTTFMPLLDGSRTTWMCDVGPDISEGGVVFEREGTPGDLEPGRVALHAHRGSHSLPADALALDGTGGAVVVTRAYGYGGSGTVRGAPPPSDPILLHEDASDGLWLWGTDGASETAVGVLRGARDGESVVPRDQSLDRASGEMLVDGELPIAPSRAVYGVVHSPGDGLYITDGLLVSQGGANSASPAEDVTFPKNTWIRGRHGVAVSEGDVARRVGARDGVPVFFRRFDSTRGTLPETADCFDTEPPADCISLANVMPAAVDLDVEGGVYVLDAERGQVWYNAPGSADFTVIATGFVLPSDMVVRAEPNRTLVYVLDGHVYSFVADPGGVAR